MVFCFSFLLDPTSRKDKQKRQKFTHLRFLHKECVIKIFYIYINRYKLLLFLRKCVCVYSLRNIEYNVNYLRYFLFV